MVGLLCQTVGTTDAVYHVVGAVLGVYFVGRVLRMFRVR